MKVKISYQTLLLPPPFSFGYTLDLQIKESEMSVKFQLEYLNRDTITVEEILNEGYSENDDFEWEGVLSEVWSHEMQSLKTIPLTETSNHESIWMHFQIEDKEKKSGLAKNIELWDFRIQELIQAIYEKAQIELPLNVKLIHHSNGQNHDFEIQGQFEKLEAKINGEIISWRKMQEAMSSIFTADINQDGVKKPLENGLWIYSDDDKLYFKLELKNKDIEGVINSISQP